MRLIDADKLKEAFPARHNNKFVLIADVRAAINQAPEVDAVPVIRCRDCCYWIPGLITDNDCFIPPKCGKYQRGKYQQMVGHSADDYCSYAERREGNE